MNYLIDAVLELANKELIKANSTHPLFRSMHEGESVIREEIEETKAELDTVSRAMQNLWYSVKADDVKQANASIRAMLNASMRMAAESVQVVAMCLKWLRSADSKEELDGLITVICDKFCKQEECDKCEVTVLENILRKEFSQWE